MDAANATDAADTALVQKYSEAGFLGGTFLFGQDLCCLTYLVKLGSKQVFLPELGVRRLQPFMSRRWPASPPAMYGPIPRPV